MDGAGYEATAPFVGGTAGDRPEEEGVTLDPYEDEADGSDEMEDVIDEIEAAGDEMEAAEDIPPSPRPTTPPGTLREVQVPGGTAYAIRNTDNEIRLVASGSFGRRDALRPLSVDTRISRFTFHTLAGRNVVEIRAQDDRWKTTYLWEYGRNHMHFVAEDQRNGEINISNQPGTPEVLRAHLGYVPTRTWRSRAERAAAADASKRYNVVLGAYEPWDTAGYDARLRRVSPSRHTILVASSESLGMNPGFRILYVGPFTGRATAERVRDEMRRYTSDAYISNAP